MSVSGLLRIFGYPISKITLSVIVVLYLLIFNLATAKNFHESIYFGIWPALLVLSFFALLSFLPRLILKCMASLFILITLISIFFKFKYNAVISEDIVLSAWVNDIDLTREMLSPSLMWWVISGVALPVTYVAWAPIKPISLSGQALQSLIVIAVCGAGIAAIFHFSGIQLKSRGNIRDPQIAASLHYFSPVDALYSAYSARKSLRKFKRNYTNVRKLSQHYHYNLAPEMDDLVVVVVVGETARGDHFSLNGYSRITNPRLSTVAGLHSFANARSCDTITIRSIKCIFSRVIPESPAQGMTESAFTDVFRHLGFRIDIYSLQRLTDVYSYLGYDKLISKYAILGYSQVGVKDEALLPLLENTIATHQGKQLVILHTIGSHQTYAERVTNTFQKFKPFCSDPDVARCPHNELINAYDNTILATDAFLHDAIQMLASKKAVLLYVSDHGESLGENNVFYHGLPRHMAPNEQFDVPLIVWLSQPLINTPSGQKMSTHLEQMDKRAEVSHAHFFHSVLGCSGVSSRDGGMDEKLNLCGDS